MKQIIYICDGCGERIEGALYQRGGADNNEYCGDCVQPEATDECEHEDNASDEAAGKDTVRLVCKACGYDRIEQSEVA